MPRAKPPLLRLHELPAGQLADFFALLVERTKNATRDGKPYYTCRFRDAHRTASFMVWSDSGFFEACETDWRVGQFYKIRGTYGEHDRYGAQLDVQEIRAVSDSDRVDGFDPAAFVDSSRFNPDAM